MILKEDKNTYSIALEIAEVSAKDGGEYKAVAKNEHGESTATITLNFEGKVMPTTGNQILIPVNPLFISKLKWSRKKIMLSDHMCIKNSI